MTIKNIIVPSDFGNDFDVGNIEPDKIHTNIDGVTIQRAANGVLSAVAGSKAYLMARKLFSQVVLTNSDILFDTVAAVDPSDKISLNTITGFFTLQPGAYLLEGSTGSTSFSAPAGLLIYTWYKQSPAPAQPVPLAVSARAYPPTSGSSVSGLDITKAIYTVPQVTTISMRVLTATSITATALNSACWATIREL